MNYQTFQPRADFLQPVVKCYWTLEVEQQKDVQKQLIIPDGCIEMIFNLGDDVKRFTSGEDFIIQPREMVLGQITEPFYIQPLGYVNAFGIRFYPYSFSNFVSGSIKKLANKETPQALLFGEKSSIALAADIIKAATTVRRIEIMEAFLLEKLTDKAVINKIVRATVDTILSSGGAAAINTILKNDLSKRRQLERNFASQIGMSPKQLAKVIRLQSALKLLLNQRSESLTAIAYESDYYDQAHFIRDFKDFTGITPGSFLDDERMKLSSIFYKGN